ncbi:MAG: hypothetical protein SGJ02_09865 [bacterium]|nr:hypothetical protein [bacterium]
MEKISTLGAHLESVTGLMRFIPEPKSSIASTFGTVMRSVAGAVSGESGRSVVSLEPSYQSLLEKQIQLQEQMQIVTMESNIEKTKHESKMAAVRNFRAG